MALMNGSRLGPYEIVAPLGAGGMGEVYRARDARLNRDVALKVLPPVFANDPERMARFEREAQVLASLNHPHIASLYGLEESGGVRALVMELVEGPTLAERIAAGPLPLDEALPIARQIAEALEAAHEKNVIHRDLKPANVKLTRDGAVKVLDFGLAKALDDDPGASSAHNSPTISLAATRAGVILGTAAYMSPEQAKGRSVDRRADIWAFGVVLMEMLTGRQMYAGETAAETLAFVMTKEPGFDALPADLPGALRQLLHRCLDKDPRRRLQAIGEARLVLEDTSWGDSPEPLPAPRPASTAGPGGPARPWGAALLAVTTLVAVWVSVLHFRETPPVTRTVRFAAPPPEKASVQQFAVSPDGRYLAITASAEGKRQLWVRALEALQPQALAGTDEASYPFWSPDSRYIGFFAQGKLRKIAVSGGPPQSLCDAPDGRGGTWNDDGVIVFAPTAQGALQRVPAVGGVPSPVTQLEERGLHRFPVFLPDGRHFLYLTSAAPEGKNGVYFASLDSRAGRRVLADESRVVYAPPALANRNGHLLFIRENTLMAQPFDVKTLQPAGELFPVAEQVSFTGVRQYAPLTVSHDVLAYQSGRSVLGNQLAWFDRGGKPLGPVGTSGLFFTVALSPDGKTVAIPRFPPAGGTSDLWLRDLVRNTEARFTFHASLNGRPVWSPDGSRIVFNSSRRAGRFDLYHKNASGAGQDELLVESNNNKSPTQWSWDGKFLVYEEFDTKAKNDLWVLPMDGARKPVLFLQTEFQEIQGQLSPDSRWMAYTSDESGRREVYVRPFPAGAPNKWKISTAGGEQSRWRRDGKELFYLAPDRKLMAVAVKAVAGPKPAFEAGAPEALFDARVPPAVGAQAPFQYEISADGKRFLIVTSGGETAEVPITVVLDWQRAGTSGK